MKQIISIIPTLNKIGGHEYWYHLAMGEAATLNGWEHCALFPKQPPFPDQPETWHAALPPLKKARYLPKPLRAFKYVLSMTFSLMKACKFSKKNAPTIFYERFSHFDLIALYLFLLFTNRKPEIWLLYRVTPNYFKKKKKIHKFVIGLLGRLVSTSHIKLITDTDLLVKDLGTFFNKQVHLLPIPHASAHSPVPFKKDTSELILWWPGGMREEKGLEFIHKLACSTSDPSIRLVVVEEMKHYIQNYSLQIEWVKSEMPRDEYDAWMHSADIILLPYLPNIHYQASSSGPFVEAIVAGKMPVTNKDTWCAHELSKYNLNELVIDWKHEDLLQGNMLFKIKQYYNDPVIRQNLRKMHDAYLAFHNQSSFTQELKRI